MKWICVCLVMIISASGFSQAQSTSSTSDTTRTSQSLLPDLSDYDGRYILYVLKSDTQTEEILISSADDITHLVDSDNIQSIEVFRGQTAMDKYGAKAEHGAVVLHFKREFNKLPKDLNGKYVRAGN